MSGVAQIFCPRLVNEIHHFLWMKPFKNRGRRDEGWSCRDYAAMVGLLLQLHGIQSTVCTGKMMVMSGPTEDGRPCGLEANPHSWNLIEGFGHVDLSVRIPRFLFPEWEAWKITRVVGSSVQSEPLANFDLAGSDSPYQQQIAVATHKKNTRGLVYRAVKREPVDSTMSIDLAGYGDQLAAYSPNSIFKILTRDLLFTSNCSGISG